MTSGMRNSVPYDTSQLFLLTFYRTRSILLSMANRAEIPYGTLDLMVLKTLDTLGPQHGYGIARRIEQAAIGPAVSCTGEIGTMPRRLTRPLVGLMPTTPQALAGERIEPSVSVPTASGARPAATP